MRRERVGTAQRDAVVDRINLAAVEGYLEEEEREDRVGKALSAKYMAQLERAVEELPAKIVRTVPEPVKPALPVKSPDDLSGWQILGIIFLWIVLIALVTTLITALASPFRHRYSYSSPPAEYTNAQPLPEFQYQQYTTYGPSFVLVFNPWSDNAGVPILAVNITGGWGCTWADTVLYGENGKTYEYPPDYRVIILPLGSRWDAKTQRVVEGKKNAHRVHGRG